MSASRSTPGAMAVLTWIASVVVTAMVVLTAPDTGDVSLQLHELGLIFAAYALAARAIACALHDWGTLVLAVVGLSFGVWFPYLNDYGGPRLVAAVAMSGWLEPAGLERLEFPLVIATAGVITAAATYLVTHSGRVFFEIVVMSLLAASVLLLPFDHSTVARGAVIGWHAGVAGSFALWSVKAAKRASGVGCPFCGNDLLGLTTPICPSCKHRLPSTCRLPGSYRRAG
jgi:hypothetical protein